MKTALITGASSGIGYELAHLFAQDGIHLIVVARSEKQLLQLKQKLETEYAIQVQVIVQDLARQDSAKQVVDAITADHRPIDFLVNNAGFGDYGLFEESDLSKLNQMMYLNMNTLTELTHLLLDDIIEQEGKIMNVGSIASFMPGPLMAVYYATKHYVLAFSEALDEEVSKHGVNVTTLCPGITESGFQSKAEMEGANILKMGMATSKEVAEFGYKKMMNGRRVAIHGFSNQLLIWLTKFLPSKWTTAIVKKVSER